MDLVHESSSLSGRTIKTQNVVFIEYNKQFFNMGVGLILDTSLLINKTSKSEEIDNFTLEK